LENPADKRAACIKRRRLNMGAIREKFLIRHDKTRHTIDA
jgi:hypothetical protein